jgi:cytochrome c oxidase cbb3-type subunit 3
MRVHPSLPQRRNLFPALLFSTLLLILTACQSSNHPAAGVPTNAPPLGQLAGSPGSSAVLSTPNPYEGNPKAIEEGKQLFGRMNCAGCHAYGATGNMGPDLTDTYWRYGGLPIQIYDTLLEGRPQGMPAWGKALGSDDLWKIVAYIQSLGGTVAVADWDHARQGDQPGEYNAPESMGPQTTGPQTTGPQTTGPQTTGPQNTGSPK